MVLRYREIIIAIIGAVALVIAAFIGVVPLFFKNNTDLPTKFAYSIRVQDKGSQENISNAQVVIDTANKAPLNTLTGSDGYARLMVESEYRGQQGRLTVIADGYEIYTQDIDLDPDRLPGIIPLESKPISLIPTDSLTTVPAMPVPPTSIFPMPVPPTSIPPTSIPPTSIPPTSIPPMPVPPTSIPPTSIPPTSIPPTPVPAALEVTCSNAVVIGSWEPIDGQGRDVYLDSGNGYIHADFWSPSGAIKSGYDEVSVILPPGTIVTVVGVAGQGWSYNSGCTLSYVEAQVQQHQNNRRAEGKRITTVSISELPTR